jgi:PAS domain S-box-containing protein/diguanylate cyclase (GGDEF)-like protein
VSSAPTIVPFPSPWSSDVLACLPAAAVELDRHGTILAANAQAARLFGCDIAHLVSGPVAPWLAVDLARPPGTERVQGRRANGVPVIVEVAMQPLDVAGDRRLCLLRELNHADLAGEAQRHFDAAFDHAPIGMTLFNCDGEYVRVNAELCTLLGRSATELLGRRDQEFTHPDDRAADVEVAWRILGGEGTTHQCEKRFVRPDGTVVWVLANLTFLRDHAGRPLSWVGQFQDVTARREAEEQLRGAEERFRQAFDHAPIGMALVGPQGDWLRVNRRLCVMLGYTEGELLSRTFQEITHPDDLGADLEHVAAMLAGEISAYEMEKRYVRRDGSAIWMLLSVSLVRAGDGTPRYFISQIQDIDARKRSQNELEQLARTDALTGVLNRRAWDLELARATTIAHRQSAPLAIAVMDLNGFKAVNDRHGHDMGDELLRRACVAWRAELRPTDTLARLGGDEFAVLLPGCGAEQLREVVVRLKAATPHGPGCGIGAAVAREGESADALLRRADIDLYVDKARAA